MSKTNNAGKNVKAAKVEVKAEPKGKVEGKVKPQVEVKAEAQPKPTAAPKDAFGNRLNTRAHVINVVLLRMPETFTTAEITKAVHESKEGLEYKAQTGQEVKAISNHLLYLYTAGHLAHDGRKWTQKSPVAKVAEKKAATKAAQKAAKK